MSDHSYATTHNSRHAVQIPWPQVERILGCGLDGYNQKHGDTLVRHLVESGCPSWVVGADAWLDAEGYGLMGPSLEN